MFVIICFHYDVSQVDDAYANIILKLGKVIDASPWYFYLYFC